MEVKGIQIGKGENKTVFVCKRHDGLCRKSVLVLLQYYIRKQKKGGN